MIHPTDDFWGHISRGTARLLWVIIFLFSGHAEICDSGIAIFLKHNILWLQVAMDYVMGVHVLQGYEDTAYYEFYIK